MNFLRVLVFFLILSSVSFAQTGYLIRNYSKKDYKAFNQNWITVQDKRGVLYFGNSSVLLEYDGETFRKIKIKDATAIRSLSIDSTGTIYVGTAGDIGFLDFDDKGNTFYHSLIDKLPEDERTFSDVWKIFSSDDRVYFQTSEKIIVLNDGKFSFIKPQHSFSSLSFFVDDHLFVREREVGLHRVEDDKLKFVPGSEAFGQLAIVGIMEYSDTSLLILSGEHGFFNISRTCLNSQTGINCISKINSSIDSILQSYGVLGLGRINNQLIGINTRNGFLFISNELELNQILNKANGLIDETVSTFMVDRQHELWLNLNNGISKVSVNSPLRVYSDKSGLEGVIECVIEIGEYVYVGSSAGLFFSKTVNEKNNSSYNIQFKKVPGINVEVWDLANYNGQLLIATSEGTYYFENSKPVRLTENYTNNLGRDSKGNLIACEKDGVRVLHKIKGQWHHKAFFNLATDDVMSAYPAFFKTFKGSLIDTSVYTQMLLTTRYKGVIRLMYDEYNFEQHYYLDTNNGLPEGNVYVAEGARGLTFLTNKGTYIYDENKDKGKKSDRAFTKIDNNENPLEDLESKNKKNAISRAVVASGYDEVKSFFDVGNIVWVVTSDNLIRLNLADTGNFNTQFSTLIRSVHIKSDSLIFNGASNIPYKITGRPGSGFVTRMISKNENALSVDLPYKLNTITFSFAAPFFEQEDKTVYSYFLQGYDSTWSAWSSSTEKEFNNLPEGDYIFQVKSKNVYGTIGKLDEFRFTISPPWYRTMLAYIGFAIAFILFIILVIWLSVRRLKIAKQKLENIVQERTAEVVLQKEQLHIQNDLLQVAYKDIRDSINYSKRIQDAILPLDRDIKEALPDSFILYLPRDIVSGDFYWINRNGDKTYFAVADCTGHGVPGAFMSLIANNALNEVIKDGALTPASILAKVNDHVVNVLKQHHQDTESRDGMDISLISLDKSYNLEFAGAYRPLYIIRNNKFSEIKGDKHPIGGSHHGIHKAFTNQWLHLKPNDVLYMFSDGFADQFGGESGKKMMVKNLKTVLLEIHHLPMNEQHDLLKDKFMKWKGNFEQVDDVLIAGIRIK